MKFVWYASTILAVVVPLIHAAQASELLAIVSTMPKCGVNCLEKWVTASPCALTDSSCTCANATLNAQIQLCVLEHCTITQQLSTKNATATICGAPVRDKTKDVSYIGVGGGILAFIAYILRMVAKLPRVGGTLGWDDAAMSIAVLLVAPITGLSVVLADLGLGRDIWTIPPENITKILQIYFYDEVFYLMALSLIKISILCLYLHIFPEKKFRRIVVIVIWVCVAYAIAFVLVTIFQCQPIRYAWQKWDGQHKGTCSNVNAQVWVSAAVNILLDLIVMILPMPLLAKLGLNLRKKILLMMMFSVGIFVTIVSIFRLQVLVQFGNTTNVTWDYTPVGYWSTVEMHVGIICACMPAIRSLLKKSLPRLMGQTTRAKSYGDSSTASNQKVSRVSARPKTTYEDNFIPLVDVESQAVAQSHNGASNAVGRTYYEP